MLKVCSNPDSKGQVASAIFEVSKIIGNEYAHAAKHFGRNRAASFGSNPISND